MLEEIVDKIYEAAFVPDLWPKVLDSLAGDSGSASASIMVFKGFQPPRFRATDVTRPGLQMFCETDAWRGNRRAPFMNFTVMQSFLCDVDYMPPELLEVDSVYRALQGLGLGWQLGTTIPMPSGEVVVFTFERWLTDGRHDPHAVAALDSLRPHLARAAMLAARLGLERARSTVETLKTIGLAAAVLDGAGRVVAVNTLLETLSGTVVSTARERMRFVDIAANALFAEAVEGGARPGGPLVRSIPLAGRDETPASVAHVLPVRGAAHDIFGGASTLVIITPVGMTRHMPGPELLRGLFDLTLKEAELSNVLAVGVTLKQAAETLNIQFSTARSYLERIFQKTGTNSQNQLVALLLSAAAVR
jgi:DNA-binding CsgD family transcriptional regulator